MKLKAPFRLYWPDWSDEPYLSDTHHMSIFPAHSFYYMVLEAPTLKRVKHVPFRSFSGAQRYAKRLQKKLKQPYIVRAFRVWHCDRDTLTELHIYGDFASYEYPR